MNGDLPLVTSTVTTLDKNIFFEPNKKFEAAVGRTYSQIITTIKGQFFFFKSAGNVI